MFKKLATNVVLETSTRCLHKSSAKMFFGTYKTSTGLVGLAVDKDGRNTLLKISAEVLDSVQKIPESSGYRQNVEKWMTYVTKVAKSTEDVKAIETEIGLGQIEEVIEMAKDELSLIDYYYDNKGWERVAIAEKEADALLEAMADSIYFNDPTRSSTAASAPGAK